MTRPNAAGYHNPARRTPKAYRGPLGPNGFAYRERYAVIVTCADEADQMATYERLRAAGRTCRVVTV